MPTSLPHPKFIFPLLLNISEDEVDENQVIYLLFAWLNEMFAVRLTTAHSQRERVSSLASEPKSFKIFPP